MPSSEETKITRWSTRDVALADRFSYWGDALSSAFVPTSLGGVDPRTCESEIRRTRLGSMEVGEHRGSAHFCRRDSAAVARSGAHHFNLILLLEGEWHMTQRGHIRLRPGDVTLHDSDLLSSMSTEARYAAINLRLSESFIREWLPNSVLTDQVGALLALVAAETRGGPAAPTTTLRSVRERILDLIQQRCQERSLTATDIAISLDISPRSLHRALAASGESFGSLLIQSRLDIATRPLNSPLFDRLTTAEVGRRAGFADASHFARSLRRHGGKTPLQIRRERSRRFYDV